MNRIELINAVDWILRILHCLRQLHLNVCRRNLLQGIRGDLWVWDLAADSEDPLRPYVWSPEQWEIQPLPFRLDRANQCYLEDLNSGCAACWRTVAETGRISFGACPTNLMRLAWVRPPPQPMRKDTPYDVSFQVAVNTDQLAIVPHEVRLLRDNANGDTD